MSDADIAIVDLPDDAACTTLKMELRGGRDLVARLIAAGGWEFFERPLPRCFYNCARRWTGTILDVGANTGFYSLLGACAAADNVVIGFEPDNFSMPLLEANIELNDLKRQIAWVALALSNRTGRATLYVPTQEHGLIESSSSLEGEFKSTHSEAREVDVDTLDGAMRRLLQPGRQVSIIKIDVEGHEASVLAGGSETIAAHRPIVFIEVLDRAEFEYLDRFISEAGYVDVVLRPDGHFIKSRVEFDPLSWNHALVPSEKVEEFLACIVE